MLFVRNDVTSETADTDTQDHKGIYLSRYKYIHKHTYTLSTLFPNNSPAVAQEVGQFVSQLYGWWIDSPATILEQYKEPPVSLDVSMECAYQTKC